MILKLRPFFWPLLLACLTPAHAENRALLVGIGAYQSITPLLGPPNDLQTFKRLLTGKLRFSESQITVLQDAKATKAAILAELKALAQTTQAGDKVVFFFSGHGGLMVDDNGDEDRDGLNDGFDEALLPYETANDRLVQHAWLRDDDIQKAFAHLEGRKILAVIDACHAGTVARGGGSGFNDAKIPNWPTSPIAASTGLLSDMAADFAHEANGLLNIQSPDFVGFFAVHPRQLSVDDTRSEPNRPHGVFTDALVRGVEGAADFNHDDQVSYRELLDYARQRTDAYCAKDSSTEACLTKPAPLLQIDLANSANDFLSFGETAPSSASQTADALLAHGNTAGLRLKIEPVPLRDPATDRCDSGNAVACLNLNQPLRYRIETRRDGKLLLFDLNPEGRLKPLFPAEKSGRYIPQPCRASMALAERIPADKPLTIPDPCMGMNVVAEEPAGPGKVVAVLIEEGHLRGLQWPPLEDTLAGVDSIKALRARLDAMVSDKKVSRALNWSVLTVDYVIR